MVRPDPLDQPPPPVGEGKTRRSAGWIRGFRTLPQGIFPAALMSRSTDQAIPTSVETQVEFDTRVYDSPYEDGQQQSGAEMVDLTNFKLVIRFVGYYTGHAFGVLTGGLAGTRRQMRVFKNGATVIGRGGGFVGPAADGTPLMVPFAGVFVPGDTIEVKVFQDSGFSMNLLFLDEGPRLEAHWGAL